MARKTGSRNADFEESRRALLSKLRARATRPDGARASFRDLAAAAGVGPATLRHYFGTREGAIRALLESAHADAAPYLLAVSRPPVAPLRDSLLLLLRRVVEGMRRGLGELHALGLAAGLRDAELGPSYIDHVLEPTLQAFEAHLAHHAAGGVLRAGVDLRLAALQLVAPIVLASLHQRELGGAKCRALDLDALVVPHVDAWLRAWKAPDPAPSQPGGPGGSAAPSTRTRPARRSFAK